MGEGSSIGGGVGRASEAGVVRLLARFFFRGGGKGREADATALGGTVEDLSGGACCVVFGGCERCRATLVPTVTLGAGGGSFARCSAHQAELAEKVTYLCPVKAGVSRRESRCRSHRAALRRCRLALHGDPETERLSMISSSAVEDGVEQSPGRWQKRDGKEIAR